MTFLFIMAVLLGLAVALFVVLVYSGVFNDPDGKENNPEYWQALQERADKERSK